MNMNFGDWHLFRSTVRYFILTELFTTCYKKVPVSVGLNWYFSIVKEKVKTVFYASVQPLYILLGSIYTAALGNLCLVAFHLEIWERGHCQLFLLSLAKTLSLTCLGQAPLSLSALALVSVLVRPTLSSFGRNPVKSLYKEPPLPVSSPSVSDQIPHPHPLVIPDHLACPQQGSCHIGSARILPALDVSS